MPEQDRSEPGQLRRRWLLGGGIAAAGAAGAGYGLGRLTPVAVEPSSPSVPGPAEPESLLVDPYGAQQAGIARPDVRQEHIGITVAAIAADVQPLPLLAELGEWIAAVVRGTDPALAGVPPARLTVTVGIGPAVVAGIRGGGPGSLDLPRFRREEIAEPFRGGDLLLQVCADDPTVIVLAEQALLAKLSGAATARWQLAGFRGALDGPSARNLLGFYDGVSVPRTADEFAADVWLAEDDAVAEHETNPEQGGRAGDAAGLAGGSVAVVRIMPIDVPAFARLPIDRQEAVIGRRRDSGVPLSGGSLDDDPNLQTKNEQGVWAIPVDAHVRRAHPLPSGAPGLMLRRSYSYSRGPADQGLIFVAFQRSLLTFTRTLARMDESDALLEFTRSTASGTFLILPGFTADRPLGSSLPRK